MAKLDLYKTTHVTKVNVFFTIIIILAMAVENILGNGTDGAIGTLVKSLLILVPQLILFFIPFKDKYLKGFLIALIPGLVMIALFLTTDFALYKHYVLIISLIMTAFHFKQKLTLTYGIIMNPLLILVYVINPAGLLGQAYAINSFIGILLLYNTLFLLLYFINGEKLVEPDKK